jgi:uroporphyrinogen III methyltransferase/synthase
MGCGKVYIVGAGPGDPGLITIKGIRCVERAEVVLHDALSSPELLRHAPEGCEIVDVGKRAGMQMQQQQDTNALMVARAKAGLRVVRLKGGDPFVFGRGGEEVQVLKAAGVPYEVVPGVSSLTAVPAYAGIPITHRGASSEVTVVTGHSRAIRGNAGGVDWEALARANTTLVILMGVANRDKIARRLIDGGRSADTPVAAVRWGTTQRQTTVRTSLGRLGETPVESPAVIVIGEVAAMDLGWFESLPLFGRSVAVTRAPQQAGRMTDRLEALGAHVVEIPTIRFDDPQDWAPADRAIRALSSFQWVVFTSANGVTRFLQRILALGGDLRDLKGVRIACIGPATAEAVAAHHLRVDLTASRRDGEGLAEAFLEAGPVRGSRFLLPRPEVAGEALPGALADAGAEVVEVACYRTVPASRLPPGARDALRPGAMDLVTFTSSSTVNGFVQLVARESLADVVDWLPAACIGPLTADAADAAGFRVVARPSREQISADSLVDAIAGYFSGLQAGSGS